MYEVREVIREDCAPFILGIHYAKRWPSISRAFGLYRESVLVGAVTYGTPPSATLRSGVAGPENVARVLELNRLVLRDNLKNEASILVGRSLAMLPKGMFIISFADKAQGHNGCVYRATNFFYCGLSAKRTDWKLKGKEHLHGQTVSDEFRGQPHRAALMRAKYGDDFYLAPRSRKHRYIFITGGPKSVKALLPLLRYRPENFIPASA